MSSLEYIVESLEEKYQQLRSTIQQLNDKPVVTVFGLLNSGKSYLLNMLTNHFDKEFFKTADWRETTEIRRYESNQIVYVDTPGLDAKEEDDKTAIQGVSSADIVLFVHQLGSGELDPIEIDALTELKKTFGDKANSNIILVISKIDKELNSPEKIQQVQERILEQCQTELDIELQCFPVSNTFFHKGIKKNSPKLIKVSQFEILAEYIQEIAQYSQGTNRDNLQRSLEELLSRINVTTRYLELHKEEKVEELANDFEVFNHNIDELRDFIEDRKKRYAQL